jgi:hypothetical protein
VEIKIDKKFFIKLGCVILFGVACFCAGQFCRFRGVSGTSDQLVDGVVLSRETTDKLFDELNLGGVSLKSGVGYEQAILEGVGTLRKSSEVGRICTDAIEQSIKSDEKFNEELRRNVSGYFDAADYAIDISINHAELYESIIRSYEQAKSNNGENNKESK